MYIVWCLVKSFKLHPALIECSISELRRFGCRIFDIRRTAVGIEKIRSEEGCFGCRIFDIRLCGRSNRKNPIRRRVLRMSNIRHSTIWPIESKNSDPTNKANRIEFATFDPSECTRLFCISFLLSSIGKKSYNWEKLQFQCGSNLCISKLVAWSNHTQAKKYF